MFRQLRIAALCCVLAGCGSGSTGPVTPSTLFDQAWSAFDREYPFFALASIDWQSIGAAYRDSVAVSTGDRETARLIGAMIGRLKDYHTGLTTPFGSFGPPPIPYEHHYSPGLVQRAYLPNATQSTSSGHIRYATIGTTGYIVIPTFVGDGWGSDIDQALSALAAAKSMIIDIRDNPGGNEAIGQVVASRFYDRKRVYRISRARTGSRYSDLGDEASTSLSPEGTTRFTGPVGLITNRFNGSAAEDFLLMMRILPQVTVVGDTTLGLGSNPGEHKLANGWTIRLSRTAQSTPDGFVYQFKGLPPGIPVAWNVADTAAGRDPYIEAALADLARRSN